MLLDPHIVSSASEVTAQKIFSAFRRLYPDMAMDDEGDLEAIEAWLAKFRRKPGLALSTGRTNSDKGMFTCSLLDALGAPCPKSPRGRLDVAWTILNSEPGRRLANCPELEVERAKWKPVYG